MAEFKLTIANPKKGECMQKEIKEDAAKDFIGKRIGDKIKGESFGASGYEFLITGGSDNCGFPMRKGISSKRKRVLTGKGVGFKGGRKGMRRRKTVCGDKIDEDTVQINLKITKQGKGSLTAESSSEEEKKEKEEKDSNKEKKEKPKE